MEPFVTIKIKSPVKHRLDTIRKDTHISEYIEQMITFFEVTMTSPRDVQTYPLIEIRKDIHALNKTVKGMEKGVLNAILTDVKKLSTGQSPLTESSESVVKQSEVTSEMIIQVVTQNEQLEAQLATEKERSIKLSNEVIQLKEELKNAPHHEKSDMDKMDALFKWLKGSLRKASFSNDYVIAESAFKEFVSRFENLTPNK